MNLSSISRRIDRLETRDRKKAPNIKIVATLCDKWAVLKDHAEFNTLTEAVNYVKSKYATKLIEVSQMYYVITQMADKELQQLINIMERDPQATDAEKQECNNEINAIKKVISVPCKPLLQVEKANPSIKFKMFVLSKEDDEEYFDQKK